MGLILKTRKQTIAEAITTISAPDIFQYWQLLAGVLADQTIPWSVGIGDPIEPAPPVSDPGDKYFDVVGEVYWTYLSTGWVLDGTGGGGGGGGGGGSTPDYDITVYGQGTPPYGYRTISGGTFPTNETWWTNAGMTTKVREKLITRNGQQQPTTIVWKFYTAGILTKTATDTITYSGIVETSRIRVVT